MDIIANIFWGEYSPELFESFEKYRTSAFKSGLLAYNSNLSKYSPLNKEEYLDEHVFYQLIGKGPDKRLYDFIEEGTLRKIHNRKQCVFCDAGHPHLDWMGNQKLYDSTMPSYSNETVEYPIKICDACLIHAYHLKKKIGDGIAGELCVDHCIECRQYYMVEPNEWDRRLYKEGRGLHMCDTCLLDKGYGNHSYIERRTCPHCDAESDFYISLMHQWGEKRCDNCDNIQSKKVEEELDDYLSQRKENDLIKKAIKDALKKSKEDDDVDIYIDKHQTEKTNFAFYKCDVEPMGYFHQEPNNIYMAIYEIQKDNNRCVTFDLVEFDQSYLVEIEFDVNQINIAKIIATIKSFAEQDDEDSTFDFLHHDYFIWSVEGFNNLYRCANEMAQNYINEIRDDMY